MSNTLDNSSYGNAAYRNEQYNYTVKWGAAGFLAGGGLLGYPIVYLASRRYPAVRKAHPSVKFSFMLSTACALGMIAADKAGLRFDRLHRNDAGAALIAAAATEEEKIWHSLTPAQKTLTYIKDNKVPVALGGLATSISSVLVYLQTTPMTGPQKLVEARVWGQGLTILTILALAGVTTIPTPGDAIKKLHEDDNQHSWIDTLEADQPELKEVLDVEKHKSRDVQK